MTLCVFHKRFRVRNGQRQQYGELKTRQERGEKQPEPTHQLAAAAFAQYPIDHWSHECSPVRPLYSTSAILNNLVLLAPHQRMQSNNPTSTTINA
jgi:hypothetical protein